MTSLTKALKGIYKQIRRYNKAKAHPQVIPKHERHGTTSDWVGIVVNALLIGLTIWAIMVSNRANETANKALSHAIIKDSLDNVRDSIRDNTDSTERVTNREFVDSTLTISTLGVNAANRSSQIAEKALNETKKSYDFSREAAKYELRAYQVVKEMRLINFKLDSIMSIEADVENVGKTPATKFKCVVAFNFDNSEINNSNILDKMIDTATAATIGSGQKTTHYVYSQIRVNSDDIKRVNNKIVTLYAYVNIEYEDAFKVKHFTHAMSAYLFDKKRFNVCKIYNEAN